MNPSFDYITYGAEATSREVTQLLRHLLDRAFAPSQLPTANRPLPSPLCIWGRHGIGKTELVEEIARELGCRLAYLSPAQFEEMGDLVGMPQIDGEATRFVPPDWAPREDGPGILLIDDVNRADDRILRGLMPLLQRHELVSWKLPPRWQIVLTANPDGGDYSVTPLDDSLITRMLHVTMSWDLPSWAAWAERTGIDARGIQFVLTYPELVSGERTTPRTLVQFFRQLEGLGDLKKELGLVKMLAEASLDRETAAAFLSFVQRQLHQLILPEEILQASDFAAVENRLKKLYEQETQRVDLLSVICTRLIHYAQRPDIQLNSLHLENLERFLTIEWIPGDLRFAMAQELVQSDAAALRQLIGRPAIGKLLLQ